MSFTYLKRNVAGIQSTETKGNKNTLFSAMGLGQKKDNGIIGQKIEICCLLFGT